VALLNGGRTGRSVINRAYYAAFYAVLALMAQAGEKPRKHSQAIGLFDKLFIKTGKMPKTSSREIHQLFRLRKINDYESLATIEETEAKAAVQNADSFVKAVKDYVLNNPPSDS
jgi:uncharacterized protein (UPF0332 family)